MHNLKMRVGAVDIAHALALVEDERFNRLRDRFNLFYRLKHANTRRAVLDNAYNAALREEARSRFTEERDYQARPVTSAEVCQLAEGRWPAGMPKGNYESVIQALALRVAELELIIDEDF